ncbi:DUF4335 domain-containing protein [Myxosarcina sp. GI1]|uniref:DUF4335 domain-containing protein n=1 Tax=Myxosarcina sp. GI1 TaxID=1541065 RepID=UPI00055FD5C7|nr:DUF4335 domain-containing protein [Myxosarcina sp. GI1]
MSITRQYNLPNCSLILEGLEDVSEDKVNILDGRSPMAILVNAECIIGADRKLSGGSVFLNNLVQAVSNYAQEFLSGLPHPQNETEYPQVKITQTENNLHRLTVESQPESSEAVTAIDLTTVEFFDLVDAIDRLASDRATLPQLALELHSVGRRYRKPEQPFADRATPAVVGVASLALAAAVLWLIPPPTVREREPELEATPTETIPTNPQTAPPTANPSSEETE